jgi:7-cyano-7-deazaguanine synthase
MCGIYGVVYKKYTTSRIVNDSLDIFNKCKERGRDSWGIVANCDRMFKKTGGTVSSPSFPAGNMQSAIGNWRGEPTTEWQKEKNLDQIQPFFSPNGRYAIAHNGTVANDKELLRKSGIPDPITSIDSYSIAAYLEKMGLSSIDDIEGSFALLVLEKKNPDSIFFATNYKPLYYLETDDAYHIASQASYFGDFWTIPKATQIPPYTCGHITCGSQPSISRSLYKEPHKTRKVLVVCSGGLDSTTVAWKYHRDGCDVKLMHFTYKCKAESREVGTIEILSEMLGNEPVIIDMDFFAEKATSPLTDPNKSISKKNQGADGAEFASEWVPARNTVFLSLALAYAEANGYDTIAIGNNMEECGAYPDNEPEFINKWNELSPFATKPYTRVKFEQPCGNMMKHEIVRLGLSLNVPYNLTWSCYEGGEKPCNSCGPCYMRRVAFEMNGKVDPLLEGI